MSDKGSDDGDPTRHQAWNDEPEEGYGPDQGLVAANRMLDRLDTEDDDRVRCDLITDLQDLAERWGGDVAHAVEADGIPIR